MARTRPEKSSEEVTSLVPARLDRLPWTKFHWSVVVGLGVAWILDGLEIQIVASAGFAKDLHMSAVQVGVAGSVYQVSARDNLGAAEQSLTRQATRVLAREVALSAAAETEGRLFGLNQTFHSHTDSKGVGLYLVHRHVTSLGGQIAVESTVGEGTSFTLSFPAEEVRRAVAPDGPPRRVGAGT